MNTVEVPAIKPTRNYLLIRLDPVPRTGIILLAPGVKVTRPYMKAHVERTGPGLMNMDGTAAGCTVQAGQDVVLMPNPTQMIPVDGGDNLASMEVEKTRFFLVTDERVIGIFDSDAEAN